MLSLCFHRSFWLLNVYSFSLVMRVDEILWLPSAFSSRSCNYSNRVSVFSFFFSSFFFLLRLWCVRDDHTLVVDIIPDAQFEEGKHPFIINVILTFVDEDHDWFPSISQFVLFRAKKSSFDNQRRKQRLFACSKFSVSNTRSTISYCSRWWKRRRWWWWTSSIFNWSG